MYNYPFNINLSDQELSHYLNIILIKRGYRRIYWLEISLNLQCDPRYSRSIGNGYIISKNLKILRNWDKLNTYKLGMYLNYIVPSSRYMEFEYGVQYYCDVDGRMIFLYGQKIPELSKKILDKIRQDVTILSKILKYPVYVKVSL